MLQLVDAYEYRELKARNCSVSQNVSSDLSLRQRKTSRLVLVFLATTILMIVVAFVVKSRLQPRPNPNIDIAVRITILIFGLGAVVLRRTRFSGMRLQDIGALAGPDGLLRTLEKTTLQLALLALVIATIGFVATLITGNDFYTYGAGGVGIFVLAYAYPSLNSWQRTIRQYTPDYPEKPKESLLA
jgi:predicted DNA repair protein MutK